MANPGKVLAIVVLSPIVVLVAGIGGCEATKAYYDWQVREMCKKDGGVAVYERIPVRAELFKARGGDRGVMSVPNESEGRRDVPVFQRMTSGVIEEGLIRVVRHEVQIVRWSDSKVIGRLVLYGRSGGDFPLTTSAPSYYQCPESGGDVVRQVLVVQGEVR